MAINDRDAVNVKAVAQPIELAPVNGLKLK